jgi:putative Holliday junction resolvase
MRVLALDWGTVRIGAAISDPEGKFAFALEKFIDSKEAIEEIKKIVTDLEVEKIILGSPKALSGQDSQSSKKVLDFQESLKLHIHIPIDLLDERFSSVAAGKALRAQGVSEKKQRAVKDNVAAQLMLQQYLDTHNK